MSWEDRRTSGAVKAAVRRTAHSDDAKHRADESTQLRTRARALPPLAILAAVVLVVVAGGIAAAVVASHGDDRRPRAATASPSPTPGKTSPSPQTSVSPDGSVRGTLVLTGTSTFRQLAFHANPGTPPVSSAATMAFTCVGVTCAVHDPSCPSPTLARSGAGYRAQKVTRTGSPYGPLVDTTTCSLVVSGGQATYSVSNTGAYKGKDADHYEAVNPQSTTLRGTFTVNP